MGRGQGGGGRGGGRGGGGGAQVETSATLNATNDRFAAQENALRAARRDIYDRLARSQISNQQASRLLQANQAKLDAHKRDFNRFISSMTGR